MKTKSNDVSLLAEAYQKVYEQTAGAGLDDFDESLPQQEMEDITGDGVMDYTLPEKAIWEMLEDYNFSILNDYKDEVVEAVARWMANSGDLNEILFEAVDSAPIIFKENDYNAEIYVRNYAFSVLPEELLEQIEAGERINILITDKTGKVIGKIPSDELEY